MEDMDAYYGLAGNTAIVEMAVCAGLPLVGENKNPFAATTYGVGQLIKDAAYRGAKNIIVGLGGSAANDGGCGAAAACGVKFYDSEKKSFIPTGGTLKDICDIDTAGFELELKDTEITVMSDITNPMYGENGAAYIFAPQKGASAADVIELDKGLRNLGGFMGDDIPFMPGSGAAGGMGAGMVFFFGAKLRSGIETVLEITRFDELIKGADFIITGEGLFDSQSLGGKAVSGIAGRAKPKNIPVILIAGGAYNIPGAYEAGISAVFTINRLPEDFSVSKRKSEDNLRETANNIFNLIKIIDSR